MRRCCRCRSRPGPADSLQKSGSLAWPESRPALLPGVQVVGGGAHGVPGVVQVLAASGAAGASLEAAESVDAPGAGGARGADGSGATSGPNGVPVSESAGAAES